MGTIIMGIGAGGGGKKKKKKKIIITIVIIIIIIIINIMAITARTEMAILQIVHRDVKRRGHG